MFLYFNLENMLGKISYELCNNSFDYILSVFYITSYVLQMYYISYASKTNGIFPFRRTYYLSSMMLLLLLYLYCQLQGGVYDRSNRGLKIL